MSNINIQNLTKGINTNDLKSALDIVFFKKALKQVFTDSPPQVGILVSFVVFMFLGLPIYSFQHNPLWQIGIYLIVGFILTLLFYKSTPKGAGRWGVGLSILTATLFWFYIFINAYRLQQQEKSVGKKSFICDPTNICDNDGINGPFNGINNYIYAPPSSKERSPYIPSNQFVRDLPNTFTYTFWLKINYDVWKSEDFLGLDKIVLLKGTTVNSADMSVWVLPNTNAIQVEVGSGTKNISISVDYPFNKWVQYAVVVNENVAEVYKNATLERSMVIPLGGRLSDTNMYIGVDPQNSKYNNFPGQLLYLSYQNSALLPGDIYEIYEKEYNKISKLDDSVNQSGGTTNSCPDTCSENELTKSTDQTGSETNADETGFNESTTRTLAYQPTSRIPQSTDLISQDIINKFISDTQK